MGVHALAPCSISWSGSKPGSWGHLEAHSFAHPAINAECQLGPQLATGQNTCTWLFMCPGLPHNVVVCSRGKHPERKRFPGKSISPFMTWPLKPCSIISASSHLSSPSQGPPQAQRESIHIDFVMGSASIRKTTQDQKYCCGNFWTYNLPQTHIFSVHAKPLQSCATLCNPMDCSPPVFSVHGILWARILEWVAIPFARGFSPPRDWTHVSYISCIGRQVLYTRAAWEVCMYVKSEMVYNK